MELKVVSNIVDYIYIKKKCIARQGPSVFLNDFIWQSNYNNYRLPPRKVNVNLKRYIITANINDFGKWQPVVKWQM